MKYCRSLFTGSILAALLLPAVGCGDGKAEGEATVPKERVVIVEVEDVTLEKVEDWVDLPGMIEPFRTVTVSAEVGGLLEDLGAEEGEEVKEGQRLAVIDRENLEIREHQVSLALEQANVGLETSGAQGLQAEALLAQARELERKAKAMLDETRRSHERGKALFDEQLAPRSRLDELGMALEAAAADLASAGEGVKAAEAGVAVAAAGRKSAETALKSAEANLDEARLYLRRSTIVSPLDGFLDWTANEEGELVKAQDPFMRIVQMKPVKAVFHLPEKDVPYLKKGVGAEVTVDALSPQPRKGTVSLIGVTSDPSTSTYRLEVDLPNADDLLKAGMLARLRLLRQGFDGAVTAPVFAVVAEGKRSYLFLYDGGTARRREVTTGIVDGDRVQITWGLDEGERLIVKGQRDLEDGQQVALP